MVFRERTGYQFSPTECKRGTSEIDRQLTAKGKGGESQE